MSPTEHLESAPAQGPPSSSERPGVRVRALGAASVLTGSGYFPALALR
jgi:hypothetical protein